MWPGGLIQITLTGKIKACTCRRPSYIASRSGFFAAAGTHSCASSRHFSTAALRSCLPLRLHYILSRQAQQIRRVIRRDRRPAALRLEPAAPILRDPRLRLQQRLRRHDNLRPNENFGACVFLPVGRGPLSFFGSRPVTLGSEWLRRPLPYL